METKVMIVGVGGAGCNIADRVDAGIKPYPYKNNVRTVAINTDRQSLINLKSVKDHITLGKRGRGAGSDPEKGKELALKAWENGDLDMLKFTDEIDYDLIIVIAGLGGGTGTGAGPVIVNYLKEAFPESTILSVLILPDADEYGEKTEMVNRGLVEFYRLSDSILLIDNSKIVDRTKPLSQAYDYANEFTKEVVITTLDICERYGNPNIDFADIQTVFRRSRESSRFAFISSLEFPTEDMITEEEIRKKLLDLKQKTAIHTFMEATSLIVASFHSGNLPSQKVMELVETLKSEITRGGRAPYVKRGDYIDPNQKTVKFGIIIGGVQVDPKIADVISRSLERFLGEENEGNLEGNKGRLI